MIHTVLQGDVSVKCERPLHPQSKNCKDLTNGNIFMFVPEEEGGGDLREGGGYAGGGGGRKRLNSTDLQNVAWDMKKQEYAIALL